MSTVEPICLNLPSLKDYRQSAKRVANSYTSQLYTMFSQAQDAFNYNEPQNLDTKNVNNNSPYEKMKLDKGEITHVRENTQISFT